MANDNGNTGRLYYSIAEVAKLLGVAESTLRYWEKEIPSLRPRTTSTKIRQYTTKDIETLRLLHNLVKVRGFKLASARRMLRENRKDVELKARLLDTLISVRDELRELRSQLGDM